MSHPFLETLSKHFVKNNIAVLRFQFRYMEQKSKRPDPPAIAHKAVDVALQKANKLFPELSVFAAGKSFGGRMSSQYLSINKLPFVKGIVFLGFPLHVPGKPSVDRADHLIEVGLPMLFLQGTRDALADKYLIKKISSKLKNTSLHFFEGADHSFCAGKKVFIEELAEASVAWMMIQK